MSETANPGPDDGGALQFDHAEYAEADPGPSSPACAACKQAIPEAYFEVNGAVVCPRCRVLVEAAVKRGAGPGGFLRALAFGVAAALAGFGVYYGVWVISEGRPYDLILILVGFMVGSAVRKGSRGYGGWVFQALAIFLTYTAISASYSTAILPKLVAQMMERRAQKDGADADVNAKADAKAADPADAKAAADPAPGGNAAARPRPSLGGFVVALLAVGAFVLIFSYSIPVLVGIQSPIILLIVGFALWEAWKLNRRMPLRVTGPYLVGDGALSVEDAPGAAADA